MEDLISAGADMERADTTGHTPLHYAAGYGRYVSVAIAKTCPASSQPMHAAGHRRPKN